MKFRKRHILLLVCLPLLIWFYFCLPKPLFNVPYSVVVNSNKGELLGASIAQDEQWRFPINQSVSKKFEKCITYFEDEYFFFHIGVNPVSLAKAFYQNIVAGEIVRGGSTLSMQVIRLARVDQPRTYLEKLYECILALRLELRFSKAEILNLYAAHAPFGGNVVGLEAASWRYFGRSSQKLSWGETASLAVLPNAPALIFPGKNHQLLLDKRNRLLDKLGRNEVLDATTVVLAKAEPIPGTPKRLPNVTPHLVGNALTKHKNGAILKSTIDKNLQVQINALVESHHKKLAQNQIHNAAVLVVDVNAGAVKAYVGNTSEVKKQNDNDVDIITASRSSGSTLKPFLYALMQQEGQLLPETLLPDIPTYIAGYSPKNFNEKFDGAVKANKALARSLNVPAVRMLQDYGVEKFHEHLNALGFNTVNRSASNYGLSLILGGAEVTLWDLVNAYRNMALDLNQFKSSQDTLYGMHVTQATKQLVKLNLPFDASAIWLTLEALTEMERPDEGNQWQLFNSSQKIAWKTGTSFGHRDAWAVGITAGYVVGVWVGNADGEGRPGLTGTTSAAPLMFDVFKELPQKAWFNKPEADLVVQKVCHQSGYKASSYCMMVDTVDIAPAGVQTEPCPYHQLVHLDKSKNYQVNSECYPVADMQNVSWFVLPPVMEWYYKSTNPYYKKLPSYLATCQPAINNMDVIYPKQHAKLFIPRGFEGEKQKLVFEATHRMSNTTLHWHLDNEYLQSTSSIHQIELQPAVGKHVLTVVDNDGLSLQRDFEVVSR